MASCATSCACRIICWYSGHTHVHSGLRHTLIVQERWQLPVMHIPLRTMHRTAGMCDKALKDLRSCLGSLEAFHGLKLSQPGLQGLSRAHLCFQRLSDPGGLFLLALCPVKGIHQGGQLLGCVLLDCLLHLHQCCPGLQTPLPQPKAPALTAAPGGFMLEGQCIVLDCRSALPLSQEVVEPSRCPCWTDCQGTSHCQRRSLLLYT